MTTQDIVDVLNDLLKTDPEAISALFWNRVPANEKLLNHSTAMCNVKNEALDFPTIGLLGVIQAIAAKDGDIIVACCDENDVIMIISFNSMPTKKTKKYTVIYMEAWMSGSHRQTITKIQRIQVSPEETLNEVLKREDLYDVMCFVLEGWPHHVKIDGSSIPQDENGEPIL